HETRGARVECALDGGQRWLRVRHVVQHIEQGDQVVRRGQAFTHVAYFEAHALRETRAARVPDRGGNCGGVAVIANQPCLRRADADREQRLTVATADIRDRPAGV